MSLRNPLARVRGLGSAKDGTHHWWAQRVTAIALVPLSLWFVAAIIAHVGAPLDEVRAWLASPVTASLLIALIVATFHHAQLGLQVVIEDYVHDECRKTAAMLVMKGLAFFLGLVAVVSVLKIAFGG